MRRFPSSGTGTCRALALAVTTLIACLFDDVQSAAAAAQAPVALSALQSFKGSIAYTAHRASDPDRAIAGELSVSSGRFNVDERSSIGIVHVADSQSWVEQDGHKLYFQDPLSANLLANPWAVMLGACSTLALGADPSGHSWTLGDAMRVYPDADDSGRIDGLVDISQGADASFSFRNWHDVQGMWLPASIVRFRAGVVDDSMVIDSYRVAFAAKDTGVSAAQMPETVTEPTLPAASAATPSETQRAIRIFFILFGVLAIAFALVVWTRRDALITTVSRRLALDPRAWRDEGTTAFVTPEGLLWFGGRRYRVGAVFHNRRVTVQSSPFFIRISAPDAGLPLVLARKFVRQSDAAVTRKAAAGFTLLEALVATALFACVIVGAVFPALIVTAHADRVAALHEAAVQVATNALVDEEAALAYGTSALATGSATSRVDGLDLTISVAPSTVSGMELVTAAVDDRSGAPLVRIATMIGPPVPPPDDTPSRSRTR